MFQEPPEFWGSWGVIASIRPHPHGLRIRSFVTKPHSHSEADLLPWACQPGGAGEPLVEGSRDEAALVPVALERSPCAACDRHKVTFGRLRRLLMRCNSESGLLWFLKLRNPPNCPLHSPKVIGRHPLREQMRKRFCRSAVSPGECCPMRVFLLENDRVHVRDSAQK
jgi:hypothetical protein